MLDWILSFFYSDPVERCSKEQNYYDSKVKIAIISFAIAIIFLLLIGGVYIF